MRRITPILASFSGLLLMSGMLACTTSEPGGEEKENQPPNVWLSSAPPEGTVDKYTIRLFWGGWDPDGEILRYEYKITNNTGGTFAPADTVGPWDVVIGNDSTFTFTADLPNDPNNNTDTVAEFRRSHTFFVRAVDREGLRSTQAAHRSFTSRTLSPRVRVDVPRKNGLNPADVPPISTFRWTAEDYVSDLFSLQDPESVQTAMISTKPFGEIWIDAINYLRKDPATLVRYGKTPEDSDNEWSAWKWYKAPQDSGKTLTTPPLDFGPYVFAIRAKDEAGAVTPVLDENENVRRVRVSPRSTGPLLTVFNDFMGSVVTTTCQSPITIIDLPAGVVVSFAFQANADSYGGTVSGYRYGWDITDLADPTQWEIDYTPFTATVATSPPRQFGFGTHVFTIEVVDNSGFCSRAQVKINYIQFTMGKNLLLVDDYPADKSGQAGWGNVFGRGGLPNDAEHDCFWLYMLDDLEGFEPAVDVLEVSTGSILPLPVVADYKSIIWNNFGSRGQVQEFPLLYQFLQFRTKNPGTVGTGGGKQQPNLIALFMAAGGHVFIHGNHPVQNSINRSLAPGSRYPFLAKYDYEGNQNRTPNVNQPVGDLSFGYRELCLESWDYSVTSLSVIRNAGLFCPVVGWRGTDGTSQRMDGMRSAEPLDPNFPRLELRPETAGPGKQYDPAVRGMDVEVYNPFYVTQVTGCKGTIPGPRSCFQPIYGLGCFDVNEPTYMQPIAFWTSVYVDRVPENGVGARSVVFGFSPAHFKPAQVKGAVEYILYTEWQLPRRSDSGQPPLPVNCTY